MKKLEIISITENEYKLSDNEGNLYSFIMIFYDLDKKLTVKDHLYMNEKLLDKNYHEYSTLYYFGKPDSVYARKTISEDNVDIIGIKIDKDIIYLQRHYG